MNSVNNYAVNQSTKILYNAIPIDIILVYYNAIII